MKFLRTNNGVVHFKIPNDGYWTNEISKIYKNYVSFYWTNDIFEQTFEIINYNFLTEQIIFLNKQFYWTNDFNELSVQWENEQNRWKMNANFWERRKLIFCWMIEQKKTKCFFHEQ